MIATITPDNFGKRGFYKYVCFEGGIVYFCNALNHNVSHLCVVNEHPNLKALSAGSIGIDMKKWKITDGVSMTAKLSSSPTDNDTLDKALKPFGLHPKEEK
jgi:hypothetical protein